MANGINAIANLLGKVNANGALLVTLDGGAGSATTMTVDTLTFNNANPDVSLSRGAANRLDLATGDSFNIVDGGLTVGGSLGITLGSGAPIVWTSRLNMVAPADGLLRLSNNAGTDFTRLILGTNDASGVAIKKSGVGILLRLGDDSAYCTLSAGNVHAQGTLNSEGILHVANAVATPAGGSTAIRLVFGTTAGFGIYVGSGAPTVSAAQGSIYLRSNGSSTSTRCYVNTDGGTTWTNFVTAA